MGYNLVTEILNHAPATLTPKEMVAALAFAADANDGTRLTWNSVEDPMFLRQLRVGRARLYELLDALVTKGVLVLASAGHRHGCAKYRFAVLDPSQCPEAPDTEAPPKCPESPDTEDVFSVQVSRTLNHDQCPEFPDVSVRDSRTPTSQYQSVLSPVVPRPSEAVPNGHRERENLGEPNTTDPVDSIVNAWIEAWARMHGVPHPVKTPKIIRRDARELLAEGIDAELLHLAAVDMAKKRGWNSLHKHLEYFTPPAVASQAPGTPARTAADCRWCDPFGWYEHTNGRDARCTHPDDPPPGHPAAANTRSAA